MPLRLPSPRPPGIPRQSRRQVRCARRAEAVRAQVARAAAALAPPAAAEARPAAEGQARAADLGRRGREARRRARGRPGRRGLSRAARAPFDRRQHLPRRRRQRPAGDGGRVRRDRAREERVPLRRRDRRPRARGPQERPQDPGSDPEGPDGARPGGQGPDEDEGRAPHDRGLARRPLRRLCPAQRGPGRLAAPRGRRARAPEGDPQGLRSEGRRRDRSHRRRGRVARGHRARPRLPAAPLEDDRGAREGLAGSGAHLPGGRAAPAGRARPVHRGLREAPGRPRPHPPAHRRLPEEDVAPHGRPGRALEASASP